jgi:hypothetical protein
MDPIFILGLCISIILIAIILMFRDGMAKAATRNEIYNKFENNSLNSLLKLRKQYYVSISAVNDLIEKKSSPGYYSRKAIRERRLKRERQSSAPCA